MMRGISHVAYSAALVAVVTAALVCAGSKRHYFPQGLTVARTRPEEKRPQEGSRNLCVAEPKIGSPSREEAVQWLVTFASASQAA